MLRTSDLLVLGEELVPPVGYQADGMVAMTYSLDLVAALALPLAVVRQGAFAGETAETADRYATLEAITRIAPRFRVFYDMAGLQAGVGADCWRPWAASRSQSQCRGAVSAGRRSTRSSSSSASRRKTLGRSCAFSA